MSRLFKKNNGSDGEDVDAERDITGSTGSAAMQLAVAKNSKKKSVNKKNSTSRHSLTGSRSPSPTGSGGLGGYRKKPSTGRGSTSPGKKKLSFTRRSGSMQMLQSAQA